MSKTKADVTPVETAVADPASTTPTTSIYAVFGHNPLLPLGLVRVALPADTDVSSFARPATDADLEMARGRVTDVTL